MKPVRGGANTAGRSILAGTLVCWAAAGLAVHSQPVRADEEAAALEEVVVTAQKRSENLQSVPVSVTALTSNQLGSLKLDDASVLATQIPNLQVNGIVGEGSPLFSLRGVSMFDYSLSQSSPVASYIDEVYKGNFVLFGVEMYDLERVEVLRGPQGTLYGKNTTGGAINFITHKPGFDTEGYAKVGFGNYNRKEAEGAFQTALIPDKLAVRVAATYTKADGFIENILPGHPNLEGVDQYGVRVSLLYKATDDLGFTLRYSKSMQDPYNYAILPGRVSALGVGFVGSYPTSDGTATGTPLATNQVAQNYTPRRRQDNEAVSLTTNWTLNDNYAITAISSWDEGSLFNPEGTDGSPIDIFKIPYIGKTRQVAQDVRLTTTGFDAFNYIVGAYYQHEVIFNSTENQFYNFLDYNGDGVINYLDCVDSSFNTPGGGYAAGFFVNASCRYYNQFDQIKNSWALYTDASYKLSELFKLHAGVRYNHDNGEQKNALNQLRGPDEVPIANILATPVPILALPGSPNYAQIVGQTFSQAVHNTAVTGRAGIDYTPTRDSLLYLSYSRGYRSAAFNAQFLFTDSDFTTVKPETLDSIEAGFKTSWLENRLQVDGAVFHYQYKNQQIINVYPTGQQPLVNLGKSRIDGGELEVVVRPVRTLIARVGLGFLDTEVQQGMLASGDISGQKLPNAPAVSANVSADWDAWTGSWGGVRLHLDSSFAARQYLALPQENPISQSAYSLLNARLAFHGAADQWDVGLWGNNLGNKFYLTNAVDLQGLGYDYRHRGVPRTYGLDATYRF
ncbi:MAG TPA: TonB-dependent receptor [Steroidobacteraceae bacterium]|nr:TonB-dependent receptor [Steroidobacteraceae bacterium]